MSKSCTPWLIIGISLLFLLVLLCYCFSFKYAATGIDAYYYIGVTRRILEGRIPFVDFNLSYTPFSFYLMCIPISLFGSDHATIQVSFYLVQWLCSLLMYMVAYKHTHSVILSLSSSLFLISSFYVLGGTFYGLEPFVVFWGLLGLLFLQKCSNWGFFIAGICGAFSFLSKQYGLGYIVLYLLYILFSSSERQSKVSRLLYLNAGFVITLTLCLGYFIVQGASVPDLYVLSGTRYAKWGMSSLMTGVYLIVVWFPVLIPAIFYFIKNKLYKYSFLLCPLLGIVCFLLPTYVRAYGHYVLLAVPFTVIFIVQVYCNLKEKLQRRVFVSFLVVSLAYQCYNLCGIATLYVSTNNRLFVTTQAPLIAELIPVGSENVYVSSSYLEVALANDYQPPLMKERGMSNGFVEDVTGKSRLILASQYCYIHREELEYLIEENFGLKEYLDLHFLQKEIFLNDGEYYATVYYPKR